MSIEMKECVEILFLSSIIKFIRRKKSRKYKSLEKSLQSSSFYYCSIDYNSEMIISFTE
jgi:hypothetical protein